MDVLDLPYKAEYAKSSRASCRGCKSQIGKETLRLAVMVQSPMFDGKVPHWYHMSCFFGKQRPKTVGDIAHFETLRYEDQEKIKEKIENASEIIVPQKKGKKRASEAGSKSDFIIEYSKSSRAMCRGCEQKIVKDEIRVSKKDFETDVGKRYGGQDMWHHVECFAKLRSELAYFESAEMLPGFNALSVNDKNNVKTQIPAIKQEEVPIKKLKVEDEVDSKTKDDDKRLKEQSKIMYKYRDMLKDQLQKKELQLLLEYNKQQIPSGTDRILDRLSDVMTFGALLKCTKCQSGQYVFHKNAYVCQGDLTEWAKCQNIDAEPKRKPFKVPSELKEKYSFLNKYKYKPLKRIIVNLPASTSTTIKKEDETDSGPKVQRAKPPLFNMNFIIAGIKKEEKSQMSKDISRLGGKVVSSDKGGSPIMAVISTREHVDGDKLLQHIVTAKKNDYHVVSVDFVNEAKEYKGDIADLIIAKSICTWGSDPNSRVVKEDPLKSNKSKSMFTKSMPSKMTMKIKGGGAVDPESGLEDEAHVYQSGKDKYNAVLGLTDLQTQKNSYYKIQLLEADNKRRYWVFRAWGRISTTIGGNKLEDMDSLDDAIQQFKSLYEEKTGNQWKRRHNFVKVPGKMYPIDVDYDEAQEEALKITEDDVSSKLAKPVQDLIRLIFDVNLMKKVMLEFELDMEKMPLGKLSKKQIQSAFSVLSELQSLVNTGGSDHAFIDASNRFYTFIPHSFGVEQPPLLNTPEIIKEKLEMLDSLLELEIAHSLMKSSHKSETGSVIDGHYEQLKTEIDILPKDSEEFVLLQKYVKNTHAETHAQYELELEEVFVVKRRGEEKRFKPFRKLPNRKLLWHGSRTTNYAGILSQGLRIAPPEAPVTGYMFGKGVYFADMVSKSANYCCTSVNNSTGLLLLCEVALGNMYEREKADYVEKLPKGKHSTKGCGMTHPNPDEAVIRDDVEIPLGKPVKVPGLQSSLLYNEYIVYDVAQVNMKYLLKVNFKYKF